ncbi:phage holin family protein [Methyloversatilis universalis]|nr:phage holin family protein [Methyloversatilis universalis]
MNPQTLMPSRPPDAPVVPVAHGIDWLTLLLMVAIALWGGVVSYLRYLAKGARFSFWFCVSHISSAGLAGFCVALLCQDNHVSMPLTGVACAIAGHMGAELIKIIEDRVRARGKVAP